MSVFFNLFKKNCVFPAFQVNAAKLLIECVMMLWLDSAAHLFMKCEAKTHSDSNIMRDVRWWLPLKAPFVPPHNRSACTFFRKMMIHKTVRNAEKRPLQRVPSRESMMSKLSSISLGLEKTLDTYRNNITSCECYIHRLLRQPPRPQTSSMWYYLWCFNWQISKPPHFIYHVLLLSPPPVVCSTVLLCALNVLVFGNEQPRNGS